MRKMEEECPVTLKDIKTGELAEFGARVEGAGGRAIVIVHPFYNQYARKDRAYRKSILGLLKKSNTPLLILEESREFLRTQKIFEKLGAKNYLVLPTVKSDSSLVLFPGAEQGKFVAESGCEELIGLLQELGAKRVQVCGSNASRYWEPKVRIYEKKWLPRHRKPTNASIAGQCVGFVYSELIKSKKFEVRLVPNACYPHKPRYPVREKKPFLKRFRLPRIRGLKA